MGDSAFIHRKLAKKAIGLATQFIPGGATAVDIAQRVIASRVTSSGAGVAAKWTPSQLAGGLVHLRHGHTGETSGHSWLTPAMATAARGGCGPGFYKNQAGSCSPFSGTEPVAALAPVARPRKPTAFATPTQASIMPTPFMPSPQGPCPPGTWSTPFGCINKPGGVVTGGGAVLTGGEVVMGQYGAAMVPDVEMIKRASCLRGMVLGSDGYCYNTSQIRNKDRMWPKGRRPLLTGGDMAAISKAARAAGRLNKAKSRLETIGLLKKPTPTRRRNGPPAAPRVTAVSDDSILRIGKG